MDFQLRKIVTLPPSADPVPETSLTRDRRLSENRAVLTFSLKLIDSNTKSIILGKSEERLSNISLFQERYKLSPWELNQ
jgi:hypothetical protein